MFKQKTIIIIVIFIGAAIVGLSGFGLKEYFAGQEKSKIPAPPEIEKPKIRVTSFIGRIVGIGKGMIKVEASAKRNQDIYGEKIILAVTITKETKYLEQEIPEKIPEGGIPSSFRKSREIAFEDLKIDDTVIVGAQENIAWKKEFTAQYIKRIE